MLVKYDTVDLLLHIVIPAKARKGLWDWTHAFVGVIKREGFHGFSIG